MYEILVPLAVTASIFAAFALAWWLDGRARRDPVINPIDTTCLTTETAPAWVDPPRGSKWEFLGHVLVVVDYVWLSERDEQVQGVVCMYTTENGMFRHAHFSRSQWAGVTNYRKRSTTRTGER